MGGSLVAITEAGHILAFGIEPFELLREKLNLSEAKCLGVPTDRDVLIGFRDGVIGRMSVPSLDVQPIARVPGRPVWIGQLRRSEELVVVYAQPVKPPSRYFERLADYAVRHLPSGRDVRVKDATAYFLDDQDRLWLGTDHGEWGGGVQVVEPGSDRAKDIKLPHRYDAKNVYGFLQVGREVWAYGGISHFSTSAFIARVSTVGLAAILHHTDHIWFGRREKPPRSPNTPISHIAKLGNRLLVVASSDVFETDAKLERWKRVSRLDLLYLPGRPDAVGNYPAVRSIHVLGNRLYAATRRNGYVEVGPNGVVPHALPRELPVAARAVVAATDEIIVAGMGEDWVVLGPNGDWELARARLLPPLPPDEGLRDATSTDDEAIRSWCDVRFFPRADGGLRIVAQSGLSDGFGCMHGRGTLIEGVRRDGRFTEQARISPTFELGRLFELPDGRIATVDPEYALWALEAGNFRKIAENWIWHIGDSLGAYGDGWITQTHGGLALVRKTPSGKPLFTPLAVAIEGAQPGVEHAVRTSTNTLLATSDRGLLSYDIPSGIVTPLRPKGLSGHPTWIGRDARGRIWLAAEGLYLFVSRHLVLPIDGTMPFLDAVTIHSVALNGNRLILALGPRGLLVLDTDEIARLLFRKELMRKPQAQ